MGEGKAFEIDASKLAEEARFDGVLAEVDGATLRLCCAWTCREPRLSRSRAKSWTDGVPARGPSP
ncbi:MAG: hypothetical protein OXC54_04460 [Rhodospirillaceae bacterium]|nr:hypothetical protein [Rhodospirillaceae bacterium]